MADYSMKAEITGDSSGYVSAVDKAKKAQAKSAVELITDFFILGQFKHPPRSPFRQLRLP